MVLRAFVEVLVVNQGPLRLCCRHRAKDMKQFVCCRCHEDQFCGERKFCFHRPCNSEIFRFLQKNMKNANDFLFICFSCDCDDDGCSADHCQWDIKLSGTCLRSAAVAMLVGSCGVRAMTGYTTLFPSQGWKLEVVLYDAARDVLVAPHRMRITS